MTKAFKRVKANKGGAGIDGMQVEALQGYLCEAWSFIKAEILEGRYKPSCVKQVTIPKPNGGERKLGIPTVVDRLIQQAISQCVSQVYDKGFSDSSYGFRPGRNAHQAVRRAQEHLNEGNIYVIELDLEKFFDRVNHDKLMTLLSRKISDKRVLKLIRRYLTSGVMIGGIASKREEGTPQGSPLSPLLSNIILDELDKELEKRGHCFVRYADDCSIYVKSRKAAERVKESLTKYIETNLLLRINVEKTRISLPHESTLLGFSFYREKQGYQIRIAPKSLRRLKEKLRLMTSRRTPQGLRQRVEALRAVIPGWVNYFRIAQAKRHMQEMDEWIRTRLRMCVWKQWKRIRTKIRELLNLSVNHEKAVQWGSTSLGYCRVAHSPILLSTLTNNYFTQHGYVSFTSVYLRN